MPLSMNQNQTVSPAAWIGWDWADEHHDLFVQEATGKTESLRWSLGCVEVLRKIQIDRLSNIEMRPIRYDTLRHG